MESSNVYAKACKKHHCTRDIGNMQQKRRKGGPGVPAAPAAPALPAVPALPAAPAAPERTAHHVRRLWPHAPSTSSKWPDLSLASHQTCGSRSPVKKRRGSQTARDSVTHDRSLDLPRWKMGGRRLAGALDPVIWRPFRTHWLIHPSASPSLSKRQTKRTGDWNRALHCANYCNCSGRYQASYVPHHWHNIA